MTDEPATRTRRQNRTGTVYKTADGSWRAEVHWVSREGKRQRATRRAPTEKAARAALRELVRQATAGTSRADQQTTLSQYWQRWKEGGLGYSPNGKPRKASTVDLYRKSANTHILPALGDMRLAKITPGDVETLISGLTRQRASRQGMAGQAVSDQTRRTIYTVLRLMLDSAVRDGLIPTNPTHPVARPVVDDREEAEYLTAEQMRQAIDAVESTRLEPLIVLLATTAVRVGEALAIRWSDLDLDAGQVRIAGTVRRVAGTTERTSPKSLRSRRTLPLAAVAVAALRRWRVSQVQDRMRAGTSWYQEGEKYVFTTDSGRLLDQRNAARALQRAYARAGLELPARFHVFRHGVATIMLTEGNVSDRVAAEILGHSSTRLTTDTYAHVRQQHKVAALGTVAGRIG